MTRTIPFDELKARLAGSVVTPADPDFAGRREGLIWNGRKPAGQPRAIVFHEKNGRRHAHCVWSRIDAARMRAINMDHSRRKLMDISISLYRDHGWLMPEGFLDIKPLVKITGKERRVLNISTSIRSFIF